QDRRRAERGLDRGAQGAPRRQELLRGRRRRDRAGRGLRAARRGPVQRRAVRARPAAAGRRVHLLQVLPGAPPQPAGQGGRWNAGVHRLRRLTVSDRPPRRGTLDPVTLSSTVPVLRRRLDADLPAPRQAHHRAAGVDLHAREDLTLAPGERALVPTGVAVALPDGYAGFVHPRSGLAARHGITIVNAPGTVDAGYRGEILVNLLNTDRHETFTVHRGDRI